MKWREQHEAFKKLAIQQGISQLEHLNTALPFGYTVPRERIDKWLNGMLTLPRNFASLRRYVNRFKLGADPEFIFVNPREPVRMDARTMGLQQGLAFGMDNNGRLVEIRPYPSRSALNVVASILTTLRWLAVFHPKTLLYDWQAGAFLLGDGIGGHVHFGRKRPGRNIEVKALDTIEEELLQLRAYPLAEVKRRREGDGRNHPYGLPGDIRKQMHGYEYRTFPSWLDSPELAFLTITLSKLAVQNPALAQGYIPLPNMGRYLQRIWNLLSYYKDIDDDARLALCLISKRLPVHQGGDFKKRWGIETTVPITTKVQFIPASIKPTCADIEEMFNYLRFGTSLVFKTPVPNWVPAAPPEGYSMAIQSANTWGAKGLGELLWDVVQHKNAQYVFGNIREGRYFFSIPKELALTLPKNWKQLCQNKIVTHSNDGKTIYTQEKMREGANFSEARRLLLETILPFWRISQVKADSILQWQSTLVPSPRNQYSGKILHGDVSTLPIKGL